MNEILEVQMNQIKQDGYVTKIVEKKEFGF